MPCSRRRLVTLLLIVSAALFYRLWRLDLMSFSFDFAAALFRARETFHLGFPPLTGIENSLGFRNPGGFIWIILPAALISPRPEITAAWMGLLTMSALWPLYKVGKQLTGRPPYIALVLYGLHPWMVFGSRTVWAQHLMPAAGIWALYFLSILMKAFHCQSPSRVPAQSTDSVTAQSDEPDLDGPAAAGRPRPECSFRYAFAALAILAYATAIHISGVLYFLLAAMLLFALFRNSRRAVSAPIAAVGLFLFLLVAPSGVDYYERNFGAAAEAGGDQQTSGIGLRSAYTTRLHDSIGGIFGYFNSPAPLGGLEKDLRPVPLRVAAGFDLLFLLLCFAGIARCALAYRRTNEGEAPFLMRFLPLWILLPPIVGAALLSRPNGTYFAPAVPVLYLCADAGAAWIADRRKVLAAMLPALALVAGGAYTVFIVDCLDTISRTRFAGYAYYIPVRDQRSVAHRLAREVPASHILHLKGSWFAHTFNYLATEEARAPKQHGGKYAVITETYWLPPDVKSYLRARFDRKTGEILYRVFSDRAAAEQFIQTIRQELQTTG